MHARVLQQEHLDRALAGNPVAAAARAALLSVQQGLGVFCRAAQKGHGSMSDTLDASVLIVGGTGGIGRALAERYASLGSHVVITSRDAGRAAAAAAEIG